MNFTIVWKAEFQNGNPVIRVKGLPIGFQPCRLETIAKLIDGKFGELDWVQLGESNDEHDKNRAFQNVRRTRQNIDVACGSGTGGSLIESGGGTIYRLVVPKDEIIIHDNIALLAGTHLDGELVERLLENYKAYRCAT